MPSVCAKLDAVVDRDAGTAYSDVDKGPLGDGRIARDLEGISDAK